MKTKAAASLNTSEPAGSLPSSNLTRRTFLRTGATAAAATTILPRHVLGGAGSVAPSEKLTVAYVGCGTQGIRELLRLLTIPEVQVVAVCDPVKDANNYVDWSKDGLRTSIATTLGQPDWRRGAPGISGGRDVAKEIIETYYAKQRGAETFKGCATYVDFRELLEKETGIDVVKIMTPDHLHATIAIAAMKKGRHVVMHKPLANRLQEARLVIETTRATKVHTHFLPASDGSRIRPIKAWIDDGAIGTLREVHNWSNRPVWPQYPTIPTDTPPVPENFDWPLWLGPSVDRPYHPHYTHAVFRGWYEFGGGALADMGHYSLWPVFTEFDLDAPVAVESRPSHVCGLNGSVAVRVRNDYSFPAACTIRFRFAAKGNRPALDLFWYDGSMKPSTPEELEAENKELPLEGMMFVGDKGRILAGFRGETPQIISGPKRHESTAAKNPPPRAAAQRSERLGDADWVTAFKAGKSTYGDFLRAGPISDAFNLGAVSLRLGGKRLRFDAANVKVTNLPEANRYLTREYHKGWELTGV
ncbi:MAG: Gfo/Idh/MocA family oxidoreductase [Opitutaceae bacterium]|nr:Gfo/Idh/MocA family oxidoreductase [Opitutaceae bacterium]